MAGEASGGRTAMSGTALGVRLIPTTRKYENLHQLYKIAVPEALSLKSKLDESLGQEEVPPFEPDEVKIFLFERRAQDPGRGGKHQSGKRGRVGRYAWANIPELETTLRQCFNEPGQNRSSNGETFSRDFGARWCRVAGDRIIQCAAILIAKESSS